MNKKIFRFSYGSSWKKFESKSTVSFINIVSSILTICICFFSINNSKLEHILLEFMSDAIVYFELIIAIIIFVYFNVNSLLPQKVILTKDVIKIKRRFLFFDILTIFRGFNDTIKIDKITNIEIDRDRDPRWFTLPVFSITGKLDWDNMVVIETNHKWHYYAPVENSAEFIELVTEYVNEYRMKNGLEELKIEDNFSI